MSQRAYHVYKKYTIRELHDRDRRLTEDPANRFPPGNLYLYTKATRKKRNAIRWAVAMPLADEHTREKR